MDSIGNFKRPDKKGKHGWQTSTDGFISAERFKRNKDKGPGVHFQRREEDSGQSARLDDFNRTDGYHPATQPAISAAVQDDRVILPTGPRRRSKLAQTPKKKRWWLPRRPKSWKRFFKRSAIVVAAVVFLAGGFLAYKLYTAQKQVLTGGGQAAAVCNGDVPVEKLNTEGDSRVNVLLVGIGGPGHDGPDLTDTLIVASVDTFNDRIDLLSIPRDLWVQYSNGYSAGKINAVYAYAKQSSTSKKNADKIKDGLKELDKIVSKITGVPIHYNTLVSFKAFKEAVDTVGGVTVNVPETLYDPTVAWENNWSPVIAKSGSQKFNGAKALLYARSRATSSDFARGERQRLLLVALKDKVLSLGTYSNPLKVSKLLTSFGNNVYTDFDLGSIKCLYEQISEIPSSKIKSLDLVKPPHALLTTGPINGLSTVFPRAGVFEYGAIQSYARNAMRDSVLAKENASVMVLNGTSTGGLATKYRDILKSYGYKTAKPGDAPTHNYQQTILVDLRNGQNKYTLNYLEKRFKLKADGKLPDGAISPGEADFVIILGADSAQ